MVTPNTRLNVSIPFCNVMLSIGTGVSSLPLVDTGAVGVSSDNKLLNKFVQTNNICKYPLAAKEQCCSYNVVLN